MELVNALPNEIWLQIFYSLPIASMLSVMLTSRRFNDLANVNSIWQNLIAEWINISSIEFPNSNQKLLFMSILLDWRKFINDIKYNDLIYIHNNIIYSGTKCTGCGNYHNYDKKDLPIYIPNSWHEMYINLCAPNNNTAVYVWENGVHVYNNKIDVPRIIRANPHLNWDFVNALDDVPPLAELQAENARQAGIRAFNDWVFNIEPMIAVTKKRYTNINFAPLSYGSSNNVIGYVSTKKVVNRVVHPKTKYVTKRQNSPKNIKRMNKNQYKTKQNKIKQNYR